MAHLIVTLSKTQKINTPPFYVDILKMSSEDY